MSRSAGIVITCAIALACAGLNMQAALRGAGDSTLRTASAGTSASSTAVNWPVDLPVEASGSAPVTLYNDAPATLTVVSQPDGRCHRIAWGGGEYALGRVNAFLVVCHDPYWPYVYAVVCPARDEPQCIRLSDLQCGRVPAGFAVRRGRPDGQTGAITWFDNLSGREQRRT